MQFDFNVERVEPGTVLEQSQCEQIMGMRREADPMAYQFALMQLNDYIERSLWKIGKQYTCTTRRGEIVILTHEEASRYNDSRFDLAIQKMRKCNRRLMAVDLGRLTRQAKEEHGHAIIRQSRILSMLKQVNRDLQPEPHVDSRPR